MEPLTTVIVGIISVFVGYIISLWRSRLRPWISLLKFGESRKQGDWVEITSKLSEASRESWHMETLPDKRARLGEVYNAFEEATIWLKIYEENEERIKTGISQLKSSGTPEDIIKAIAFLLGSKGISDTLELAILRQKIIPEYDANVKPRLQYFFNDKKEEGCFSFRLPEGFLLHFGSNFNTQPYRKEALLPMAELISRLEQEKLIDIFEKLYPILREQKEIHRVIVEEAKPIVESNSRWICEFSITNFGATPFILFPENAWLYVKGKQIKPFKLECRILHKDEEGDWVETEGVLLIKSGTTENLAIVTKKVQRDIEGGEVLRSVFKSGEADAFVKIQVLGREIPWKRWIKSTVIKFQE